MTLLVSGILKWVIEFSKIIVPLFFSRCNHKNVSVLWGVSLLGCSAMCWRLTVSGASHWCVYVMCLRPSFSLDNSRPTFICSQSNIGYFFKETSFWRGGKNIVSFLTFMGPCIVRIFQYISNKMQCYTVYFIWKQLYMFQVVPPPIIRSAYNCIYSIWYLSHCYCYLPLSWKSCNWFECALGGGRQTTAHSNSHQSVILGEIG